MEKYYVTSTKYSIHERKLKSGIVYDVYFRVYALNGEEKQIRLNGYKTTKLAKIAHAEYIQTKCETISEKPQKTIDIKKDTITVEEAARQYIASLPNQNKDSSIYDKIKIYDLFVIPDYKNVSVTKLTTEELYKWQDKLWGTYKPKTKDFYSYRYLSKIRSHFSSLLNFIEIRYNIPNNFKNVKKPKKRVSTKEMQFWTREEFQQFIDAVDDPTYHCFFSMLFFTGKRKNEVIALNKKDVKKDFIIFNKSVTKKTIDGSLYKVTSNKNEKNEKTPICEPLQKELETFIGQEPFFFSGTKPLAESTITRDFQKYCLKAGVKIIRIHDLRHSFVAMLVHLGANLFLIADLIGDNVEQVTKTYGHFYQEDKISILKKIE